jgi:uncharacterized coiled-coil protein SlyX
MGIAKQLQYLAFLCLFSPFLVTAVLPDPISTNDTMVFMKGNDARSMQKKTPEGKLKERQVCDKKKTNRINNKPSNASSTPDPTPYKLPRPIRVSPRKPRTNASGVQMAKYAEQCKQAARNYEADANAAFDDAEDEVAKRDAKIASLNLTIAANQTYIKKLQNNLTVTDHLTDRSNFNFDIPRSLSLGGGFAARLQPHVKRAVSTAYRPSVVFYLGGVLPWG